MANRYKKIHPDDVDEVNRYLEHHHAESLILQDVEWLVFAVVGFDSELKVQDPPLKWKWVLGVKKFLGLDNQSKRQSKVAGLMLSLARFCKIQPNKLVWFTNYEVTPEQRYHHCHLLIGAEGFKVDATTVCNYLRVMSYMYGFGDCLFEPYDHTQDGVGYVTKRCHLDGEEVVPVIHRSKGLNTLLKKMEVVHE